MASSSRGLGRPRKNIVREQVEHLRSLGFTWDEISSLLGASSKTIMRRAKMWNIITYSTISNEDLDGVIRNILTRFPSSGEVMVSGHLRARKVSFYVVMQCCVLIWPASSPRN